MTESEFVTRYGSDKIGALRETALDLAATTLCAFDSQNPRSYEAKLRREVEALRHALGHFDKVEVNLGFMV